ncbi:MAG: hypothetical protein NVSMB21_06620 [Vulcanimicrobiaceae bacterium]
MSAIGPDIFRAIVEKGTAGVGVFLGPDGERTLAYANAVLVEQLGYSGDPLGRTALELVGPELTRGLFAKLRAEIGDGECNGLELFSWMSRDGRRWFEIDAYLIEAGDVCALVAVTTDVTAIRDTEIASARARFAEEANEALGREIAERRSVESRLEHARYHDALTGVPNRMLLLERLDSVLRRTSRAAERSVAVVCIDLDAFKLINDRFGHTFGDLLLVTIARRIENALRAEDIVARVGGDQFVVLLNNVSPDAARSLANVVLQDVAKPIDLWERHVVITASLGIAMSDGLSTAQDLLRDADVAMSLAKARGKRRVELFVQEMRLSTQRRTHLGVDLPHALDRREFEVYYQPIVALPSGALDGFEALVRWRHPTLGLVSPLDFIALAEETGAIVDLGAWVLQTACERLARWRRELPGAAHLSISVNVSAHQLLVPGFPFLTARVLRETGLETSALHLEVTESAIVREPERVASELATLRASGVHVAMDDFGTGYASLANLKAFPFDSIKIDRSFVSEAGDSIGDPEIVRSLIVLAKGLALEVVAEGVETAKQFAQLRLLGCDRAQGYLFARPLAADDATRYIEEHSRVAASVDAGSLDLVGLATDELDRGYA